MNPNQRSVINWARYIMDQSPLLLDTETTGVNASAEIIDIGIIDAEGEILYESLIKPQNGIPSESIEIHGIDEQMVDQSPMWIDVYGRIAQITRGRHVVIYNKNFDSRMIRQECHKQSLPPIDMKDWHCAMLKFAAFIGERSYRGDFKWHKLQNATKMMGLELPAQTHRAVDDAIHTLHLVKALADIEVPAQAERLF